MTLKRPHGITAICLLLGWLTLGAAGNAVLLLSGQFEPLPRWLGLFAIAYGVTAGVSVYRLWRMSESGHQWLRAWMSACIVLFLAMAVTPFFSGSVLGSAGGLIAFLAFVIALMWALDRYVSAALKRGS